VCSSDLSDHAPFNPRVMSAQVLFTVPSG
jgi:hypothetical protein